jgi:hypothetical protein
VTGVQTCALPISYAFISLRFEYVLPYFILNSLPEMQDSNI